MVVSSVVTEHLLLKAKMTRAELKRLSVIDGFYGISSIIVVSSGLSLWLGGIGKPVEFYTNNPIFLTKVGLFIVVGLLSLYPTIFFLKNRKGDVQSELIELPKSIKIVIRMELLILFSIPLLATLMVNGVGLKS